MNDHAVHDDIEIPVKNGAVRATRHEPTDESPQPVVLIYTPYHKDDLSDTRSDPMVSYLVRAGFEVVIADAVGTGASDGLVEQPFTEAEGLHGSAVVEWLANRPWSNGRVGVIGKSYPGTTALEIAAQNPDGLAAIVPIHAPAAIYDAYFDGGALASLRTCGQWAPNFEYLPLQPPVNRDISAWAERWADRLDSLKYREPFLFQYLAHLEKDEYWAEKDVAVEKISVPTLGVGGYRDAFGGGTVDYSDRIDAPTEVILGPWRHTMPEQGEAARIDFLGEVESWFDHHLREGDEREPNPEIRYWTERPDEENYHSGEWRTLESWPVAEDHTVDFDFGPDGLSTDVSTPDSTTDRWHVDYSVGTASIGFEIPGGTDLDTTPDDDRSLTYETGPLDGAFELTGSGEVHLELIPDEPAQLVAVRIVDVGPDGTGQLVTHGVRRCELAGKIDPLGTPGTATEPLTPGEPHDVGVSLRPTSHVFEPGHTLRVAVSGAFFPYVSPPDGSAGFSLRTAGCECRLPGRFHSESPTFEDRYSFDPPQDIYSEPESPSWQTAVSHTDDTVTVSLSRAYSQQLSEATFDYKTETTASVERETLSTETIDRQTTTTLSFPTETITSRVDSSVSRSFATVQYTAERDGTVFYRERKRTAVNR
ncbi:CocE/NonD family hydrolase [Halorubrum sp. CGM5_25_10-8B]|uniref:CocE/NonD family hydrolase n=1 Tax=Halorubrum sp. CGM5_25_10-8B TaxID=2518115 RepID=UPI0010FA376E|nr:CocE/NonD family hydrolase [Halorubrum sp. CGM5_25_10-8B]TKX37603.1 CocE/NonD family hydrolase [Halorubrum sp. CGM5_25_10-8B]